MKKVLYLIIFTLPFFTSTSSFLYAQKTEEQLVESKADLYYKMQDFDRASIEYLALLANRDYDILTNDRINVKFAMNLYHIRKYKEAEKRFGAVAARNIAAFTPESACAYVATLIRNSKFKQAADVAQQFNRESSTYRKYQPLQNFVNGLAEQVKPEGFEMATIAKALFNQAGSNSASIRYKDGIIFVNNEEEDRAMIKEAQFFYYDGSVCESYTKVPHTMQAGPACFYNNGKTILYTDNRYRDGQFIVEQKDKKLATNLLHILELSYDEKNQQWEKPKDIFSNKSMFSLCHPTVSEDGEYLYFSANLGGEEEGMNIYMSRKTKKGWSEPVNLGIAVNTKNDELYPNIQGKVLSFSSNGHEGSGGMDVYTVELDDSGLPVAETLKHLPYPINTIYNDYALMFDSSNGGFFTSDRPDDDMLDAIYAWSNEVRAIAKDPLVEHSVVVAQSQAFLQPKEYRQYAAKSVAIQLVKGATNPDAVAFFEYNSDKLSSAAKRAINRFIEEQKGEHSPIVVLGYADAIGTEERNIELSAQRAESVKRYMLSKGYPEDLIEAVGKGKLMLAQEEQQKSSDIIERLAPARKTEIKILSY